MYGDYYFGLNPSYAEKERGRSDKIRLEFEQSELDVVFTDAIKIKIQTDFLLWSLINIIAIRFDMIFTCPVSN